MLLENAKMIKQLLGEVDSAIIWPGFKLYPFAIYNQTDYYLVNPFRTPLNLSQVKPTIYRGQTDERFLGNTAIAYEEGFIAIWDSRTIGLLDKEHLASMMVHEMFHAYQRERGEQRFPNELLGVNYPFTVENLVLRYIERDLLLKACLSDNSIQQLELLANYFQLRHQRQQTIEEALSFEKGIESIEGTALYVEYQVLLQLKKGTVRLVEFIEGYTVISADHLKIRLSSYHQGLLLSLLADQLLGDWQENFMCSELYLSDYIETTLGNRLPKQEPLDIKQLRIQYSEEEAELSHYVQAWNQQRDTLFEQFEQNRIGETIIGPVKITGIDPMNIMMRNHDVIHQTFLRINRGQGDEVLTGPIKTEIGEHLFDVLKIER